MLFPQQSLASPTTVGLQQSRLYGQVVHGLGGESGPLFLSTLRASLIETLFDPLVVLSCPLYQSQRTDGQVMVLQLARSEPHGFLLDGREALWLIGRTSVVGKRQSSEGGGTDNSTQQGLWSLDTAEGLPFLLLPLSFFALFPPPSELFVYTPVALFTVLYFFSCLSPFTTSHPKQWISQVQKQSQVFLGIPRIQHRAWLFHGNSGMVKWISEWKRMFKRSEG